MTGINQPRADFLRIFDSTCAAAALLVLSPVFGLVTLLVLLEDRGPAIFRQTRVGRNGVYFQILKFRTMRANSKGSLITAAGDRRITHVGRWLRRFKVDELPQLWNVVRGEMSLIGPRPEVPEFVRVDDPRWQAVLSVRPGITDLATLLCRDEEKFLGAQLNPAECYRERILPAKLLVNLEYQNSRTFLQDLWLLILTVRYSLCPLGFDPSRLRQRFRTQRVIYE
jgi:lipopolysaccharide/colanic/teichoic acid biosynthesis glycosyltransferase